MTLQIKRLESIFSLDKTSIHPFFVFSYYCTIERLKVLWGPRIRMSPYFTRDYGLITVLEYIHAMTNERQTPIDLSHGPHRIMTWTERFALNLPMPVRHE